MASAKPCNSFIPGTEVLMADGTTKPIEDVKIGDKVLATDPKTGRTTVEDGHRRDHGQGRKNLVKMTLGHRGRRQEATASVTATAGHPFWVPELGAWVDATDLAPANGSAPPPAPRSRSLPSNAGPQRATVHNLTVADIHTYYVLAGGNRYSFTTRPVWPVCRSRRGPGESHGS